MITQLILATTVNTAAGALGVTTAYKGLEQSLGKAVAYTATYTTVVVGLQMVIGGYLFQTPITQFFIVLAAAVLSASIGAAAIIAGFKPSL